MNRFEFLKLAAGQLNKNYSCDPLGLQPFIDYIELLDSLTDSNDLKKNSYYIY